MFIGYGVYQSKGPSYAGLSDILSGVKGTADMNHVLSLLACTCATAAILGAGASIRLYTRAMTAIVFVTAAVVVPISARAAWNPNGKVTRYFLRQPDLSA